MWATTEMSSSLPGKKQVNSPCLTVKVTGITRQQVRSFKEQGKVSHLLQDSVLCPFRLYDITEPKRPQTIITVGSSPADQSLCSPPNATFAEAFGEVVVAFDFAPPVEVELETLRRNSEMAHPVFLLQENGDVLYMLLILSTSG